MLCKRTATVSRRRRKLVTSCSSYAMLTCILRLQICHVRAAGLRHIWSAGSDVSCGLSGEQLSLEDTYHLESLIKKLKMIEKRQEALQGCVDADVIKVSRSCMTFKRIHLKHRARTRLCSAQHILLPSLLCSDTYGTCPGYSVHPIVLHKT